MSKTHEEDAHDDSLITIETFNQIHTRAQMRAAENAAHSHILEPPDIDTDIISSLIVRNSVVTATNERDNITPLPSILPSRSTFGDDSAAARPSVQHDETGIDLHANLLITQNSRLKSTCTSFCRDRPAKTLCSKSRGTGGQHARRWNEGQENLIDKSRLNCEIHFTDILEESTDADVLYKSQTKD